MVARVTARIDYVKEKVPTVNQIGYTVVESTPCGTLQVKSGGLVMCPTEEVILLHGETPSLSSPLEETKWKYNDYNVDTWKPTTDVRTVCVKCQ